MRQQPFEKSGDLTQELIKEKMKTKDREEIIDFDKNLTVNKDIFQNLNSKTSVSGKNFPQTNGRRGLYIRAKSSENPHDIAIDASLRRAIIDTGIAMILPEHLMEKIRVGKGKALYIILLDSSSSMKLDKKVRLTKALAYNLLKQSYEKKCRVALMAFRESNASLLVQPTLDVTKIENALDNLPTGGKTPLTPALYQAMRLAKKVSPEKPTIIVISDGKANVFMKNNLNEDIAFLQSQLNGISLILINAEKKYRSVGNFEKLAQQLNAEHFYLEEII